MFLFGGLHEAETSPVHMSSLSTVLAADTHPGYKAPPSSLGGRASAGHTVDHGDRHRWRPRDGPAQSVDSPPCHLQVDLEVEFGEVENVELLPDGASIPVTRGNAQQYVELYAQHLLEGSIRNQYTAFERGFLRLCSSQTLRWIGFRCAGCGMRVLCTYIFC